MMIKKIINKIKNLWNKFVAWLFIIGKNNNLSKKPLTISESAAVQMPMKTVAS